MGEQAATGRPSGRRRPTILDIATEAGVSKGLVSMVLSGRSGPGAATSVRVLAVAERLGYRKDRTATLLARRRTHLLGVTIIPSSVFHGTVAEEIQATADAAGYEVVLGSTNRTHDEQRTIETLIDFRCEALLLLGLTMPTKQATQLVAGTPTVYVGRRMEIPDVDVVRADDGRAIADVVDHLVSLGHERIVHLDGGPGPIAALRRRAYQAAMRRHHLGTRVIAGGVTEAHGSAAFDALGDSRDVTAVVAFNDRTAFGLLDRLKRAGIRVPDDISVTGFDDSVVARHSLIDLTTVDQAPIEQARVAVRTAIERLDGTDGAPRQIVLPAQLIVRSSTGPPPTSRPTKRTGRRPAR